MIEQLYHLLDHLLGLEVEAHDMTVAQMSARAIFVFVSALVILRVANKRFFARRNALDVLLTLVLASTLARAINGSAAFFPTIIVGFLLVLVHRLVAWSAASSDLIGKLVKGSATMIVEDGKVNATMLRRHALSRHDLDEDLRLNGVEAPNAVRSATLERNGEVSVIKR